MTSAAPALNLERFAAPLAAIDQAVEGYAEFGAGCPPQLVDAMRHSLLAPGKRLRPLLTLLACECSGGVAEQALPAACAVEFVHTYSLIHDDLPAMDDDELRRGRPSCHVAFDEATAILAGDALLARAFEILAADIQPVEAALECVRVLSHAAGPRQMVGGQMDDLLADGERGLGVGSRGEEMGEVATVSLGHLEAIHHRKTGAMISAALEMGAIVAGADESRRRNLAEFGQLIGPAFQVVDDLLDVESNPAEFGKNVGKDQRQGKLTYPALLGIEDSRHFAARLIDQSHAVLSSSETYEPLHFLASFILNRRR